MPKLLRNPLYHWSHIELARYRAGVGDRGHLAEVLQRDALAVHVLPPGAAPMIRLVQTSRAMISGCQPQGGSFVYLSGDRCANVALAGNDLSSLETPVEIAPGTPANALRQI